MMHKVLKLTRIGAVAFVTLLIGCKSSSYDSVHTYDYNNEPHSVRSTSAGETGTRHDEPADGEWKMVAPGKMVSPGEMVDDPERR